MCWKVISKAQQHRQIPWAYYSLRACTSAASFLGILHIGKGGRIPTYLPVLRLGDNRFTGSIIAIAGITLSFMSYMYMSSQLLIQWSSGHKGRVIHFMGSLPIIFKQ